MVQPIGPMYLARAAGSDSASARSRPSTDRNGSLSGQRIRENRLGRIAPGLGVAFQYFNMRSRLSRRGEQPPRPPILRTTRAPGADVRSVFEMAVFPTT